MERWDVVVVGGGMAGGAAAARAAGAGARVLVLEGRSPAGRAATDERAGFRLNRGAHALYDRGPGRAVLDRLGVAVTGAAPPLAGALGRRGDVVDRLPVGPASAVATRLVSSRDKAKLAAVLAGSLRWDLQQLAGRSIAGWIDEDLGLRGAARQLFASLVRLSSYVADHDRVSADVAASQLRLASRGVTYVDGGWAPLVGGLLDVARRSGATVRRQPVDAVEPLAEGGAVLTAGEERLVADAVVLATGSPTSTARLLPGAAATWTGLGPAIAAACLDLGLHHVPDVGTLIGVDLPLYLIRHAPPARLAPAGGAVVHVMEYQTGDQVTPVGDTRRRLEDHARIAGIEPTAAPVARHLHHMVVVSAAATPAAGGLAGRPRIDSAGLAGLFVAGDWIGPVGHLVDASLASGEAAGAAAAARAGRAPVTVPIGGSAPALVR